MPIIDVTLRESIFRSPAIQRLDAVRTVALLAKTVVDYIEIGYLKFDGDRDHPLRFYSGEYIDSCYAACRGDARLVGMMHPSDFQPWCYDAESIAKLALVRVTCTADTITAAGPIIDYFAALGVETSINLLRSSNYSLRECVACMQTTRDQGADCFYIADSNGYLLPHDVAALIEALKNGAGCMKIGFHPHDNLGMAAANAVAALRAGVDFIDSSMLGYGKGAGNLRTEMLPILMARIGMPLDGETITAMFDASAFFQTCISAKGYSFEETFNFAMSGLYNLDMNVDRRLRERALREGHRLHKLVVDYARRECHD
jgi:4-hydroxy 2-oxovalerate aldolase